MAAKRLVPMSGAVIAEAGNVMLGLMTGAMRPFVVELLLPWVRQLALLEPEGSLTQLSRARQTELTRSGFCVAYPSQCLPPLFEYTLVESATGLPEIVASFWRTLALAAPPIRAGMPPLNVAPIAAWLTTQALQQKTSRDRDTCRTLALFVKGLSVQSEEEIEAQKAVAGRKAKGVMAAMKQAKLAEIRARSLSTDQTMMTDAQRRRAKAVSVMQQASRQRREKSTRADLVAAEQAERRRRQKESLEQQQRALEAEQQKQEQEQQQQQQQQQEEAWKRKEATHTQRDRDDVEADADLWASSTDVEFRDGGLEMKLADGRRVGPARLKRMSRPAHELGIPELDLEVAREKQRGRERQRAQAAAAAAAAQQAKQQELELQQQKIQEQHS